MKLFAIFGASGCGRGVLPLVRQKLQVALAAGHADLVFVDDHPPAPVVNGQRVLTYAQWLSVPASSRHMNVAIANSRLREQLVQRCAADGVQFFEVRAANVVQLDEVRLGEGAELHHFKRPAVQAGPYLTEEDGAAQLAAHLPSQQGQRHCQKKQGQNRSRQIK